MLKRFLALVVSLLAMTGIAHADHLSVSGKVYYRERIALPPGVTLYVGLVTLPTGQPVVGAGAAIPVRGQVPLQFTLNIRSDAATHRAFGVVAEIRVGLSVLFRNTVAVPVDLNSSAPVSILVTRQQIDIAEPEPEPVPAIDPALVGQKWQVTSIGGSPVLGDSALTLIIAPDLRADGHAGCNDYFTQATIEDDALRFGLAAATRKACSPQVMAQEAAFFAALSAISAYEVAEDSLRLLDAAGIPLIGLVRASQ